MQAQLCAGNVQAHLVSLGLAGLLKLAEFGRSISPLTASCLQLDIAVNYLTGYEDDKGLISYDLRVIRHAPMAAPCPTEAHGVAHAPGMPAQICLNGCQHACTWRMSSLLLSGLSHVWHMGGGSQCR